MGSGCGWSDSEGRDAVVGAEPDRAGGDVQQRHSGAQAWGTQEGFWGTIWKTKKIEEDVGWSRFGTRTQETEVLYWESGGAWRQTASVRGLGSVGHEGERYHEPSPSGCLGQGFWPGSRHNPPVLPSLPDPRAV